MQANKITMKNVPVFALGIAQDLKRYPWVRKTRAKKQRWSLAYVVSWYGDFDGDVIYKHLQDRLKYYYLTYFNINGEKEIKRMKEIQQSLDVKKRVIKKILGDTIENLSTIWKENE